MKSAWGEAKAKETMISFSNTFLLFFIFVRPHLCQDNSMEKQRLKQDLLIGMMCLFIILLILLIIGCIFLHFNLINKVVALKKELKSFAAQVHSMEKKVTQSLRTKQLTSSKWMPGQPPSPKPSPKPKVVKPKAQRPTPPKPKSNLQKSKSYIHQSKPFKNIHLEESGKVYSLEHSQSSYSSSGSDSKESLMGRNSQDEEGEGNQDSGSVLYFAIHQM